MSRLIDFIVDFIVILFGPKKRNRRVYARTSGTTDDPIAAESKASPQTKNFKGSYYTKKSVLSKVENAWYRNALSAIGEDFIICPKVRVEDAIGVQKGLGRSGHASARGRIKSRHFDFVICNQGMAPIAAIEIDDASHHTDKGKEQDAFKNALCDAVSLPMLRFKSNPTSSVEEIQKTILNTLKT